MLNSLGVLNFVRTVIICSMTVRADNAVKFKFHSLGNVTDVIVTGSMTVRIGNAAKYKCNTLSSAVHVTVELFICTCSQ